MRSMKADALLKKHIWYVSFPFVFIETNENSMEQKVLEVKLQRKVGIPEKNLIISEPGSSATSSEA